MIVVDTNVMVPLFIASENTEKVLNLAKVDDEWIAPYLWRSEFRNVLAIYLRKKLILLDDFYLVMEQAENLLADKEFEVPSSAVLDLVTKSTCSAYDCEYVALAMRFKTPLLTFDKKIQMQFPKIAISPNQFLH